MVNRDMCPTTEYSVSSIGQCADQLLREERLANILGITSRGIFLHTQFGKVLFLTGEPWLGPLTINLSSSFTSGNLQIGDTARLAYPSLILPTLSVVVAEDAGVWKPAPIQFKTRNYPDVVKHAEQLSAGLLDEGQSSQFLDILKIATDEKTNMSEKQEQMRVWLLSDEQNNNKDQAGFLQRFLGLGAGLTPAGDDFIVGYLLTYYYLQSETSEEAQYILEEARSKTTALSTCLIECAAKGSADERLMDTLRFIAMGGADSAQVKKELLSYGSSSGIESMAGMLAAIYLHSAK